MKKELQREALERLGEIFKNIEVEAVINEEDKENGEPAMLHTVYDVFGTTENEVYGEFFFVSGEEGAEVSFFYTVITICEEIAEDRFEELYQAIGMASSYLAAGTFAVNPISRTLIYKHLIAVPSGISGENLFDLVEAAASIGANAAELYAGVLAGIATGKETIGDLVDFMADLKLTNEE